MIKGRPPRIELFPSYDPALFFVTICTLHRQTIAELSVAHQAFRKYCLAAEELNHAVGRYVLLPDHVHLFVRGGLDFRLGRWVSGLKRAMTISLQSGQTLWQPGFFDHVLRSDEDYSQKWDYVRENPVRHGLVSASEEWPFQGEIVSIDRH